MTAPLIVGLSGTRLTSKEAAFLQRVRPAGIILFKRNVGTAAALTALVGDATAAAECRLALVDQEGGRVQRVRPPLVPAHPPAAAVGRAAASGDPSRLAFLSGRLVAGEIAPFGLNVPCLPVADVPVAGAHDVIGDRAYGNQPEAVATLAGAVAEGVLAAGSLPIIKHMPGHGRAMVDSHLALPKVDAPREELARDFAPFRALSHLPLGMTAHLRFTALDDAPATLSARVIGEVIRGEIGFGGLLMTDDISMGALGGRVADRASAALHAGCDVVLHCNGRLSEMEAIADAIPAMREDSARRLAAAHGAFRAPDGADLSRLREEFEALMAATADG